MQSSPATDTDDVPSGRQLVRPLRIGLSIGHPTGTCGSIGAFVRDTKGTIGLLSTASVLAPARSRLGDFIHQPSAADFDLTGASRAGQLSVHIARPEADKSDASDAAVAWLIEPLDAPLNAVPPGVPGAGRKIGLEGRPLQPGDLVSTAGRTTPYNHGAVEVVGAAIPVRIGGNKIEFHGCIAVRSPHGPFTLPGDAGALVWRIEDAMAAGIVFAAESVTTQEPPLTYVLPLAPILARFGLSLA